MSWERPPADPVSKAEITLVPPREWVIQTITFCADDIDNVQKCLQTGGHIRYCIPSFSCLSRLPLASGLPGLLKLAARLDLRRRLSTTHLMHTCALNCSSTHEVVGVQENSSWDCILAVQETEKLLNECGMQVIAALDARLVQLGYSTGMNSSQVKAAITQAASQHQQSLVTLAAAEEEARTTQDRSATLQAELENLQAGYERIRRQLACL